MRNTFFILFIFVLSHFSVAAQQVFLPEIISVTAKSGEVYEVVSIIGPKDRYQTLVEKIGWEKWQEEEKNNHNLTDTEAFYHQIPMLVSKEKDGLLELNRIKHSVLHSLIEYGLGDVEDMSKISYFAEELLTHRYYFLNNLDDNSGQSKWLKNALPRLRGYWSDEKLEQYKKDYLSFYEPFALLNIKNLENIILKDGSETDKAKQIMINQNRESNRKNFENILNIFKNL
ncbi:MAG: hypothetical protein EAZ85_04460 [Bacteroidetes bacterium]|nr:MAG: hypothetical protein EAZ85_04460 [Bacteroidota bacterium]TAG88671.1 MAG: hypothetical protein EAZ20_08055 [Bacteroidota bacterium]